MENIRTIILAAGAANRFGTCKLLLQHRGRTLLQHCVDKLQPLGLPAPLVVSGAWHRQLEETHPQLDLREHRGWREGMGSSLAFGIRLLPPECDGALVLLADQVAVSGADIAALLSAWQKRRRIVCAFYSERRGVPAIFPRETFTQLSRLDSDHGARGLLRNRSVAVTSLPLPAAAIDIDTQEDWQAFGESLQR